MNSATLPLRSPARQTPEALFSVSTVANLATPAPASFALPGAAGRWYRGLLVSLLLHGTAVLLVWSLSHGVRAPMVAPNVVELIRVAPLQLAPPPPPTKPAEPQAKPVSLAPPRPVSAAVPQPKTVAAPAASAETYTAPSTPAPSTPIGPVTPAAPAPTAAPAAKPAPAGPKVVSTDGIPTDYVTQVYARINRSTEYPQAARQRRQQGKVAYVLTLDPQGALLKVEIQGSGIEALDDAAKQAIERAAPFPKLPDLGGSTYLLAGNIVFKLN